MTTSTASGHVLDRLRRISGPNPKGSNLTDGERLHLIGLVGLIQTCLRLGQEDAAQAILLGVFDQLSERGMDPTDVRDIVRDQEGRGPVGVVNAIAVHPSLRGPYLD